MPKITLEALNNKIEKMAEQFEHELRAFKSKVLNESSSEDATCQETLLDKFNIMEESLNSRINDLKCDLQTLNTSIKKKINSSVMQENLNSIIFHGVKEDEESDYEKIINTLKNKLKVDIKKEQLSHVYRLGKKTNVRNNQNNVNKNKSRPVVVRFCNLWMRDMVFNRKKNLKGSDVMITEFLTSENLKLYKVCKDKFKKSAWTYRGFIYISVNDRKVQISDEDDLQKYN